MHCTQFIYVNSLEITLFRDCPLAPALPLQRVLSSGPEYHTCAGFTLAKSGESVAMLLLLLLLMMTVGRP